MKNLLFMGSIFPSFKFDSFVKNGTKNPWTVLPPPPAPRDISQVTFILERILDG
jgi:hypothetical protein